MGKVPLAVLAGDRKGGHTYVQAWRRAYPDTVSPNGVIVWTVKYSRHIAEFVVCRRRRVTRSGWYGLPS